MTCYNSELPIGPPGPVGPQGPQGPPGNTLGYKVYSATLTQSGGADPVADVLENTIGDIIWSYNLDGNYTGTLIGAFTAGKVFILLSMFGDDSGTPYTYYARRNSLDTIGLYVFQIGGSVGATILGEAPNAGCPIEIRVYN